MSHAKPTTALLLALALLGGCKKEEPAPPEDRTLAKLRQEVDRVNQGGALATGPAQAPSEDPNARLASLAAGNEAGDEPKLLLPDKNDTVHVGTVAFKLTGLEAHHSVQGEKMGLTSEDFFLQVQLVSQNVGEAAASLTLARARVVDAKGQEYGVARDAQVVAGTRQLERSWQKEERLDMVLLFEVPAAALAPGLTLVLPAGTGQEVKIPLQ